MQQAISTYQAGNVPQAEHIFKKILKRFPHNVQAMNFLRLISYRKGDYDSAIRYVKTAIKCNPADADNYYNLGFLLKSRGNLDEAIECFRKAIHYNPHFINAYYNLGNALKMTGSFDEAAASYQMVLQLDPKDFEAWNNLGNVLKEQDRLDEAIPCYEKALQINPDFALAYGNLGAALQDQGLLEKAYQCYQKALEINPRLISAFNNMGVALREEGRLDEAMAYYQKAIQVEPDDAEAHWNKAITYLLAGNFKEGWKHYESRFRKKDVSVIERTFSQPRWDGGSIEDRTLLLYAEQGLGDTVQFIRYAPQVAERGAKVIVECQKELVTLVQSVKGVEEVIEKGKELPVFDVWCPLLSLPLTFATTLETVPAHVPYMRVKSAMKEKWRERLLKDPPGYRVGLVWAGNPRYRHDRIRSGPLELISRVGEIEGIVLYSLQKDAGGQKVHSFPEEVNCIDYMAEIKDFSDTAALIENLDLVISVDTAVAHVAGALGKHVWILLPYAPDWRWLLNRQDSPWYPTMRLFRQPSRGDWESVVANVLTELRHQCSINEYE